MTIDIIERRELEEILFLAEKQEHIFFDKALVVGFKLKNGFFIQGVGMSVNPDKLDIDKLRKMAWDNAIGKLWQLEGYLLQEKMSN